MKAGKYGLKATRGRNAHSVHHPRHRHGRSAPDRHKQGICRISEGPSRLGFNLRRKERARAESGRAFSLSGRSAQCPCRLCRCTIVLHSRRILSAHLLQSLLALLPQAIGHLLADTVVLGAHLPKEAGNPEKSQARCLWSSLRRDLVALLKSRRHLP